MTILPDAHGAELDGLDDGLDGDDIDLEPLNMDAYRAARARLLGLERATAFDAQCRAAATAAEARANAALLAARRLDESASGVFGRAAARRGHAGQPHRRFAGDRFLANRPLVDASALMAAAARLPKGAHLHVHFNACLPPAVLLAVAARTPRMFVSSDVPLLRDGGWASFDRCELRFAVLAAGREVAGNVFAPDYVPRRDMGFADFLRAFPRDFPRAPSPEAWLEQKLLFTPEEAYGPLQTAEGAWELFNARTRMMKGLFNYETAFREYTRLFCEDLVRDNILYAEIRPNFMRSNQLCRDDGSGVIDNWGIMCIIVDVVSAFRAAAEADGRYFGGVKVIYCAPRVLSPPEIGAALDECLAFKRRWPDWIAGFDLVGEETKGRPLRDFAAELLGFRRRCAAAGLDVPFLLHCGETAAAGTATDENLVDALLLGARRIGHGFALPRHPRVMRLMRARRVCVELCPISNEVLGLTPRVGGHAMYALLAEGVHCAVSSDNGALFGSTLSHDFYQVMVGKADMDLFGWKQLALWSIEHACLDGPEREAMLRRWGEQWDAFVGWLAEEGGRGQGEDGQGQGQGDGQGGGQGDGQGRGQGGDGREIEQGGSDQRRGQGRDDQESGQGDGQGTVQGGDDQRRGQDGNDQRGGQGGGQASPRC